jgi:hypothetical protein
MADLFIKDEKENVQGVRPVQRAHQRLRTPREHQELRCRYKKRRKQTPQKKLARQSKHSASEVTHSLQLSMSVTQELAPELCREN